MSDELETSEEIIVKRGRKSKSKADDDGDLFPIKLKRSYRPLGDFLIERDGDLVEPDINDDGYEDRDKMFAGDVIHVPRAEARRAVNLDIAERHDDF